MHKKFEINKLTCAKLKNIKYIRHSLSLIGLISFFDVDIFLLIILLYIFPGNRVNFKILINLNKKLE